MSEIDLKEYSEFVDKVTSEESKDKQAFQERLDSLSANDVPRLLTAALGLSAESGEFTEIVKKLVKELNDFEIHHEVHIYGGVRHSFTIKGSRDYSENAEKKSWEALLKYLKENSKI